MKKIILLFLVIGYTAVAQTSIEGKHLNNTYEFSYLGKTGPNATDTATVKGTIKLEYTSNPAATTQYLTGKADLKMQLNGKLYSYSNAISGKYYTNENYVLIQASQKGDETADALPEGKKWNSFSINLISVDTKDNRLFINGMLNESNGNSYPIVLTKK